MSTQSTKFEKQSIVVFEASKIKDLQHKLSYLKTVEEFKQLKNKSILNKLHRWSAKLHCDHKSEFRGCAYGNNIDKLVAIDVQILVSQLTPNNKKYNQSILNIDVLENLLFLHCVKNGKVAIYNKIKRCKGWAMDFCRRHSFDTKIITIVGTSRSKATISKTIDSNNHHKEMLNSELEYLCDIASGFLSLKYISM
jgi:hypothetical protein